MKLKFFSFIISTLILAVMAIALAVATFVESTSGSEVARQWIYGSRWFEVVLFIFAVNLVGSLFFYKTFSWKKITVPLFHLAFVLILIGALFTRIVGVEGTVYIREGDSTNRVELAGGQTMKLPFEIELTNFELDRYPGSNSPSSYSSHVRVDDQQKGRSFEFHIYMNHILKYRGWRFFQTSYDRDEMGTLLTASHDVWGTPITYLGYFIAILAMLASLFMPGTFFRKQLRLLKPTAIILLLFMIPISGFSTKIDKSYVIPKQQAKAFGELVVQDSKGRMKVVNTLNREFMRKIYGSETFGRLNADQIALSILVFPEYWSQVELLKISNSALRNQLKLTQSLASYSQMFNQNGRYLLATEADEVFIKSPQEQSKTDKALIELDDKMNIIHGFLTGEAFSIFPVDQAQNNKWHSALDASQFVSNADDSLFLCSIFPIYLNELRNGIESGNFKAADGYLKSIQLFQQKKGASVFPSKTKVKAELFYNHLGLFNRLKMSCGILGFVLLILIFVSLYKGFNMNQIINFGFLPLTIILFVVHSLGIGLRWYIGGFVPLSNAYETMLFIAWIGLIVGIILAKPQPIVLALSLILGFTFLFVAGLNNSNPEIGNLVPVLKSPWLSIHVAVITSSYALFALVMMLSFTNMLMYILSSRTTFAQLQLKTEQMSILMHVLSILGVYLLTIGTLFGAVWANESWGRYWGWDPKETWALITILVYAFVGHMRLIPKLKNEFWFNLASFWAFTTILMTFFGVNYFLTGMHSYAGTSEAVIPVWLGYVTFALILFSIIGGIRYFKFKTVETSNLGV